MSDKIEPALTATEWGALAIASGRGDFGAHASESDGGSLRVYTDRIPASRRRALAALALHGQPFGFTREVIPALRWMITEVDGLVNWNRETHPDAESERKREQAVHGLDLIRSHIARIEALLPPDPS